MLTLSNCLGVIKINSVFQSLSQTCLCAELIFPLRRKAIKILINSFSVESKAWTQAVSDHIHTIPAQFKGDLKREFLVM